MSIRTPLACCLTVLAGAVLTASGAAVPAPHAQAAAADSTSIRIDTSELGVIDTTLVEDSGGATVTFYERLSHGRLKTLGTAQAAAGKPVTLDDATTWSCTRRTRRFLATATLPRGLTLSARGTVRTPSCSRRFRLRVPRVVAPGSEVKVRVYDRWGNGRITPRLCVISPARRASCRRLTFPNAVTIATRTFRATREGTWKVELRLGSMRLRRSIEVDPQHVAAASGSTVVATGDSLMLGLDRFLGDELAGTARVVADPRPGRGISKWTADWPLIAGGQVLSNRQDITVMLIGGTEGYPMMTPEQVEVQCCNEPWVAEYTRRIHVMMATYLQSGSGRVFWATMPAPRDERRLEISKAVNAAVLRAAQGLDDVSIVRLDRYFTPDGYSDLVRYRGRPVVVRERDGLHLNFRGQALAAKLIAELIRTQTP